MAYPNGFTYVSGPIAGRFWSDVSSTATFRANNPVTLSDDRSIIEAASDTTAIWGIALNNAADSLGGVGAGKVLVEVPLPETIYANKIEAGEAASALSVGQAYGIEKSANHLRVDPDSQTTTFVVLVGRQNGTLIDSADSSVFCRFLGDRLIQSSAGSIVIFAQD